MPSAAEIIKKLGLEPLPEEGGYYKETYRHSVSLPAKDVGIDAEGMRSIGTAILYLVIPKSFSALHRIKSDEIFHFYSGDPVEMVQIDPNGTVRNYLIGSNVAEGQIPQVIVPSGTWQGLRLKEGGKWALLGTTVSAGFDFKDFEISDRERLLKMFPNCPDVVLKYSRGANESTH